MGISMFVQQKMTPTAADPAQAKMMLFMPVVFTGMFVWYPVPVGLVIYWVIKLISPSTARRVSEVMGGRQAPPT
jgi:YidC/Oxa1 family membrane protein insertase